MEGEKLRVSKDPEVRKQEMIDTAMNLFAKKGYEFTSMSDIAKEMNVVSGLCYRYFKSKEDLYKTALERYAKECSAPIIKLLSADYNSIEEFFDASSKYFISTDKKEKYHDFFHKDKNMVFHRQLEILMEKEIEPHFISLLEDWKEKKIINIEDTKTAARFIFAGEVPILNDDSISSERKAQIIKYYVYKILK